VAIHTSDEGADNHDHGNSSSADATAYYEEEGIYRLRNLLSFAVCADGIITVIHVVLPGMQINSSPPSILRLIVAPRVGSVVSRVDSTEQSYRPL
jgi:hypothetical protein